MRNNILTYLLFLHKPLIGVVEVDDTSPHFNSCEIQKLPGVIWSGLQYLRISIGEDYAPYYQNTDCYETIKIVRT